MTRIVTALIFFGISSYGFAQQSVPAFSDDIQDYSAQSGIGCVSKPPITKQAEFYFLCKSRRSVDSAWSAALYKGKLACNGKNFSIFFNLNPKVEVDNEIYGAQIELKCEAPSRK